MTGHVTASCRAWLMRWPRAERGSWDGLVQRVAHEMASCRAWLMRWLLRASMCCCGHDRAVGRAPVLPSTMQKSDVQIVSVSLAVLHRRLDVCMSSDTVLVRCSNDDHAGEAVVLSPHPCEDTVLSPYPYGAVVLSPHPCEDDVLSVALPIQGGRAVAPPSRG